MGGEGEGRRYRAFISYSHRDAAFGRRLHRRLEAYSVPRRLVGRPGLAGAVPARLAPIFRDREELPAAHDLTAEVRAALAASDSLVVVSSPAAAASPWVAREVELFRALHPDRPILAALIDGEPADAFPAPMRQTAEPLAADFRPERDGQRLALLKLVAGIAGVGLDQLVQRDAQRRLRRVTAVTATAVAAMLAMGVLAAFALSARAEAERQRAEAEGMVEFMLTDLRDKLRGVGRLDIMGAVNDRALAYYHKQQLEHLPAASLERRARVLHAMGEDDETRGAHDAALGKFREARRTTSALFLAAPDDPERLFDHGQSEYWIGFVDYQRGRTAAALASFRAYEKISTRLVVRWPDNPKYLREAGYADGNLCSIALKTPGQARAALTICTSALRYMERAEAKAPSQSLLVDVSNRHGWLADAYRASGMEGPARSARLAEKAILERLIAADPENMNLRQRRIANRRALAGLDADVGNYSSARNQLLSAENDVALMIKFDPNNQEWVTLRGNILSDVKGVDYLSKQRRN